MKLTKQEIIVYSVLGSALIICLAGGISMSKQAHKNLNEFPYSGTILSTKCTYQWNNGYYEDYVKFNIAYYIKNVKYVQFYEIVSPPECETLSSTWEKSPCCKHMVGDKIWLNLAKNNNTIINAMSVTSGKSVGVEVSFAIFFFIFLVGIGVLLGYIGYHHFMSGYMKFPGFEIPAFIISKANKL